MKVKFYSHNTFVSSSKLTQKSVLYMCYTLSAIIILIIFNFMSVTGFMGNTTLPTKINKKKNCPFCVVLLKPFQRSNIKPSYNIT